MHHEDFKSFRYCTLLYNEYIASYVKEENMKNFTKCQPES